jgi:ribosomal protein L37AE/L43A
MDIKELRAVVREELKKIAEGNRAELECQECGKKFRKANPTGNTKCPKCGSHDLELAEVKTESADRDYKDEYKKFQSSTKSKKYRAELNRYNREKGTYGNGDGKDASHKGGKIVGFEKESTNRGRHEKSRLKKEEVLNESLGNFLDRTLGRLDQVIISLYQEKHIDDKQFKMLQKYLIKVMKKLDVTLKKNPPRGWKGSHLREIAERILQEKYAGNLGKHVTEAVNDLKMCINELVRLKYITRDDWSQHFVHYPKWFDMVFKKWLKGKGLQGY